MSTIQQTDKPNLLDRRVYFDKKMVYIVVCILLLFFAVLLSSCIVLWKINKRVIIYEANVEKLVAHADTLIKKQENYQKEIKNKNDYIIIRGQIPKEGLYVLPNTSKFDEKVIAYFLIKTLNTVELETNRIISFDVNINGDFLLKIPKNKAFTSSLNYRDSVGIILSEKKSIKEFLKNSIYITADLLNPFSKVDSLPLPLGNTTVLAERKNVTFPIDSVIYDAISRRYEIRPYIRREIIDTPVKGDMKLQATPSSNLQ